MKLKFVLDLKLPVMVLSSAEMAKQIVILGKSGMLLVSRKGLSLEQSLEESGT